MASPSPSRPQGLNFSGSGGPSFVPMSPKQRYSPTLHHNIMAIQDTFNQELMVDKVHSTKKYQSNTQSIRNSNNGYRTPERGRAT